jgi:hypothetical protein
MAVLLANRKELSMKQRKLRLDDLDVTTFVASPTGAAGQGTVEAHAITPVCTGTDSCAVSCPNYTCADLTCARVPC